MFINIANTSGTVSVECVCLGKQSPIQGMMKKKPCSFMSG